MENSRSERRFAGPDPFTTIIGALGSAFADAMIQTVSIYYLDDTIEQGDWGAAFDKINYGSVVWSGFTGMFVLSGKVVTIAKAVGAATAEVTYLAFTNENYTVEQVALDFARVFVSDLIGNAVGGAIGNKLKNANLSWFSDKGLRKLRSILVNATEPYSKRLYLKLAWRLEEDGLTTHGLRGIEFEDVLHQWLYEAQGFINTHHSFKAIDFHKLVNGVNLGESLKTTILKQKSKIRELIQ